MHILFFTIYPRNSFTITSDSVVSECSVENGAADFCDGASCSQCVDGYFHLDSLCLVHSMLMDTFI